ncbi:MAG: M23 family metallopeptidase [Candidatus Nanopelagicales bacterium]|jgi:murein DD-endopeptidase MepM/ murein hydrolase activator NlpD|nr:M23 family metallopeptidase [Candidatus Nanopelagicales bacterium]
MNPFALGLVVAAAAIVTTGQSPADQLPAGQPPAAQPPAGRAAGGQSPPAQWPVAPATVVAGFEPHDRFGAGHRGVDLAAAAGQPVRSALPGEVTFTGRVAGRTVVVVRHPGGVRTTYLPVIPTVAVGTPVSAGTALGRLDIDQHCELSTCLHWGARRGDDYVDPLSLLARAGPIVLLPLS